MGKRFCGFGVSTCSEFFENLHVIDPLWEGLLTGKFASKLRGWIAAGPMNLWRISSLSIGLEDTVGIACILSEPWLLTWSRSLATRVSPCRQLVHDMTITTQHYKNKQHSIQPGQQIIKASCVSGQTADHLAALRSPCESYHVSSPCEFTLYLNGVASQCESYLSARPRQKQVPVPPATRLAQAGKGNFLHQLLTKCISCE